MLQSLLKSLKVRPQFAALPPPHTEKEQSAAAFTQGHKFIARTPDLLQG